MEAYRCLYAYRDGTSVLARPCNEKSRIVSRRRPPNTSVADIRATRPSERMASVSALNACCTLIRAHCSKPKEWPLMLMTVRKRWRSESKDACGAKKDAVRNNRQDVD